MLETGKILNHKTQKLIWWKEMKSKGKKGSKAKNNSVKDTKEQKRGRNSCLNW